MLGDFGSRLRECSEHGAKDIQSSLFGLGQGGDDDLLGDAFDLEIELDAGDPDLATGDLEVHVSEVIFVSDDIGQQFEAAVRFGDDADRDASDRLQDGNAGGHQSQRGAADTGHRAGPIRFGDIRDGADGIGKRFGVGQDRRHTAFGQCPVSDFSPTGSADHATFSDRVRREVVVEHESLLVFLDRPVDSLSVTWCAEGDGADRLSFASGEDGRAVHSWQQVDAAVDVPQVVHASAIESRLVVENQVSDDELLEVMEGVLEVTSGGSIGGFFGIFREEFLDQFVLECLGLFVSFGLHAALHGGFQPCEAIGVDRGQQRVFASRFVLVLDDTEFGDQFHLQFADGNDVGLSEQNGFEHFVFGHLLGKALDHQHALEVAGDDQVERAFGGLFERGKGDELSVDFSDSHGGERSLEGDGGCDHQGGAGAGDGVNIGIVFGVDGQHVGHHLDFVLVPFGEHRADGPIGQSSGEDFPGRGPAFSLQEPTWELASCGKAFAVIDCQRKEVDATSWRSVLRGDEHDGVCVTNQDSTGGLFGQFACFQAQCPSTNLTRYNLLHVQFPYQLCGLVFEVLWALTKNTLLTRFADPGASRRLIGSMVHTSGPPALFTNTQLFDQRAVLRMVCFVEVVEQSSAATDQGQQSTSAAMVLDVRFQVHGQVLDPFGQHRDLQFRRSRIRFISAEFLNQLGLAFPGN